MTKDEEMQERIDRFMRIAREKYEENPSGWHKHYIELRNALPENSQIRNDVIKLWDGMLSDIALVKWDCDFNEFLIKGGRVEENNDYEAIQARYVARGLAPPPGVMNLQYTPEEQKRMMQAYINHR